MELSEVVQAVRKRWLVVAVITVVFAAATGLVTSLARPVYAATAEGVVSVGAPQTRPPYALANGSRYILDRMTSYAQLGVTSPVLDPVSKELDVRGPLTDKVTCSSVANQAVLRVTAEDASPTVAAKIADATLRQLGQTVEQVEHGNVVVSQVTPAAVPSAPSNHMVLRNTAVGAAAGLVLGLLLATGLGWMSERSERKSAHAGL